jgi:hypothetical protein
VRDDRKSLKTREGIFVKVEFHATEFIAGRGRISEKAIPKGARCRIYKETLAMVASLPGVRSFNAVASERKHETRVYERLLNRINRTMVEWDSHAFLVSDEGKDYTALLRRMTVHNPIPSRFGSWATGPTRNITLDRIVEDLFFRRSDRSYFIQLADFCAYALFRSERPVESKTKYGLDRAFDLLGPICTPECFSKDPRKLGIIREG